uniref:Uncharacterized protein n=1 Tax=Arundo donax TaxID=35708 RepID=A0A0A9H3M4_ARUDO
MRYGENLKILKAIKCFIFWHNFTVEVAR